MSTEEKLLLGQPIVATIGMIALAIYVWKTWQIATATSKAALATALSADSTRGSARTSELVLEEMREAREAESAPYIIAFVDVPFGTNQVMIVIKNIGQSAAKNVRIVSNPSLADQLEVTNRHSPFFLKDTTPFLPPNYELRSFMWTTIELFTDESSIRRRYDVEISYQGVYQTKTYHHSYTLDLNIFYGQTYVNAVTLKHINEQFKSMGRTHQKMADALTGLQNTLAKGVVIQNPSMLIEVLPRHGNVDYLVKNKIAQIQQKWLTWRDADKIGQYSSRENLLRQLQSLQWQLICIVPYSDDLEIVQASNRVSAIIGKLADHKIYLDGGVSWGEFHTIGDSLLHVDSSGHDVHS